MSTTSIANDQHERLFTLCRQVEFGESGHSKRAESIMVVGHLLDFSSSV